MADGPETSALEMVASEHRPTLVAVDFSDDSRAALAWACAFTACTGGKLIVLHVVHDPADQPGYYRKGKDKPLQPMEQIARRMLDDFLADVHGSHPELTAIETAERRLLTGLPPGRIVEAAELLVDKLQKDGYAVKIVSDRVEGDTLFKVRVGGYETEAEARRMSGELEGKGYRGAWVTSAS